MDQNRVLVAFHELCLDDFVDRRSPLKYAINFKLTLSLLRETKQHNSRKKTQILGKKFVSSSQALFTLTVFFFFKQKRHCSASSEGVCTRMVVNFNRVRFFFPGEFGMGNTELILSVNNASLSLTATEHENVR